MLSVNNFTFTVNKITQNKITQTLAIPDDPDMMLIVVGTAM